MHIPQAADPAETVKTMLPEAVQDVVNFRGETTLVVPAEQLVRVCNFLRDAPGLLYNFLSDISSVDYFPDVGERPGRFGVCYHLYSMIYNRRLRVKVYLQEDDPTVGSVTGIWPAANWLEREIFDMMGITFSGHPNLARILNPDDWNGNPLRRDVPLGYETVMFSFNVEEIMKHKPRGVDVDRK